MEEGLKVRKDCVVFNDGIQICEHSVSSTGLNYVQRNGKDDFVFTRINLYEPATSQSYATAALIFRWEISEFLSRAVLVSNLIERDGILDCHFEEVFFVWRVNEFTSPIIERLARESSHKPSINKGEIRSRVTFCVD